MEEQIQELQDRIKELEEEIDNLKAENEKYSDFVDVVKSELRWL